MKLVSSLTKVDTALQCFATTSGLPPHRFILLVVSARPVHSTGVGTAASGTRVLFEGTSMLSICVRIRTSFIASKPCLLGARFKLVDPQGL